jgi:hypothetical protein
MLLYIYMVIIVLTVMIWSSDGPNGSLTDKNKNSPENWSMVLSFTYVTSTASPDGVCKVSPIFIEYLGLFL